MGFHTCRLNFLLLETVIHNLHNLYISLIFEWTFYLNSLQNKLKLLIGLGGLVLCK